MRGLIIWSILVIAVVNAKTYEEVLQDALRKLDELRANLKGCQEEVERGRRAARVEDERQGETNTDARYQLQVQNLTEQWNAAKKEVNNLMERLNNEEVVREELERNKRELTHKNSELESENQKLRRQVAMHKDAAEHLGQFYDKAKDLWNEASEVVCSC